MDHPNFLLEAIIFEILKIQFCKFWLKIIYEILVDRTKISAHFPNVPFGEVSIGYFLLGLMGNAKYPLLNFRSTRTDCGTAKSIA